MKHVFWVHSHITFYMAIAVIKSQCLNNSEIVFLTDRKYQNNYFQYIMNDFSGYAGKLSPLTLKSVLNLRKIIKQLDRQLIKILQNDDYVVYLPHLAHPVYQILITNKHCRGYHFIEEGLANYVTKNYESHFLRFSVWQQFGLDVFNFFHQRICLGHKTFGHFKNFPYESSYFYLNSPYCRRKENVILLNLIQHKVNTRIPEKAAVIILSPLLEYNMVTQDGYYQCCSYLIKEISEYTKLIYVKSHPATSIQGLTMIREIVKSSGCEMVEIPNDEPIEQILLSLNENIVAGIDSSVLFYAKVLNKNLKIISAYHYLLLHDSLYKEKCNIKDIQDIFSKDINVL